MTRFIRENFSFVFWTAGGAIVFSLVVQNGLLLGLAFVVSRVTEYALRSYLVTKLEWSPARAGFFAFVTWAAMFLALGYALSASGLVNLAAP